MTQKNGSTMVPRTLLNHSLKELLDATLVPRLVLTNGAMGAYSDPVVRLNVDRCEASWGEWLAAVKVATTR